MKVCYPLSPPRQPAKYAGLPNWALLFSLVGAPALSPKPKFLILAQIRRRARSYPSPYGLGNLAKRIPSAASASPDESPRTSTPPSSAPLHSSSMRLRKMLVYHLPFLPLFCKHVRAPPVDLSPSPELHAPIKRRHRRPSAHRHARLLNVVRHLRRPLQVEMKGLPQRPQPANPLVLRRRKPHEPAVKQFQSTSHIAPVDRPHLLPFQMQYLPTRALSHGSPPNLISGTRPTPILHPPATHGMEIRKQKL